VDFRDVPRRDLPPPAAAAAAAAAADADLEPSGVREVGHRGERGGGGAVCRLRGWSVALPEQGSDFSGSGYCAHAIVA